MRIGLILTVAGVTPAGLQNSQAGELDPSAPGTCLGFTRILGKTLVERCIERFERFDIPDIAVIPEDASCSHLFPSRTASASDFVSAWEHAVADKLDHGADLILLARLGPWIEIDVQELISFHLQTGSTLTQVYDQKSALDMAVLGAAMLRSGHGSYRSRVSAEIPKHRRFVFGGYLNRLKQMSDFRRLTQDALLGRNSITPVGVQAAPNVWIAANAKVDKSAQIEGPAYIGENTKLRAFCKISGASAVERNCEIDAGAQVSDSSVLEGTFVGMGLHVSNSIVSPGKLFHLERNVELEIPDSQVIGKTFAPRSPLETAKSILSKASPRKTSNSKPATRVSASIGC